MKLLTTNIVVYGFAHAVVDAACFGVLFSILKDQIISLTAIATLFLLYNLVAFGLQVIVGFWVDNYKLPRLAAGLGLVLTAFSTLMFHQLPVAAVIVAGVGNALFHVGGGVVSLSLRPGKAGFPGAFVAPGALGVLAGTLLGKSGNFYAWPLLLTMAVLIVLIFVIKKPEMYPEQKVTQPERGFKYEYIIYLVLFVVAIRSLVGFAMVFPWKSDVSLLVILTICVCLGKGLGGFLADRFGWKRIAVGSLLLSIPLLTLGVNIPFLAILGMFLFNITMPVTLTLVSNLLPGKPGMAFGLTCLALVLGTLPAFTQYQTKLNNLVFIGIVILISALALYFSLHVYRSGQSGRESNNAILAHQDWETKSPKEGRSL